MDKEVTDLDGLYSILLRIIMSTDQAKDRSMLSSKTINNMKLAALEMDENIKEYIKRNNLEEEANQISKVGKISYIKQVLSEWENELY